MPHIRWRRFSASRSAVRIGRARPRSARGRGLGAHDPAAASALQDKAGSSSSKTRRATGAPRPRSRTWRAARRPRTRPPEPSSRSSRPALRRPRPGARAAARRGRRRPQSGPVIARRIPQLIRQGSATPDLGRKGTAQAPLPGCSLAQAVILSKQEGSTLERDDGDRVRDPSSLASSGLG
jgi:hypothetical protein